MYLKLKNTNFLRYLTGWPESGNLGYVREFGFSGNVWKNQRILLCSILVQIVITYEGLKIKNFSRKICCFPNFLTSVYKYNLMSGNSKNISGKSGKVREFH